MADFIAKKSSHFCLRPGKNILKRISPRIEWCASNSETSAFLSFFLFNGPTEAHLLEIDDGEQNIKGMASNFPRKIIARCSVARFVLTGYCRTLP